MASGDRKVKVSVMRIQNGNPVNYDVDWGFFVEDKVAFDQNCGGGSTAGSFGNTATFNAMTGSQMKSAVVTAINNDPKVPPHDSVS